MATATHTRRSNLLPLSTGILPEATPKELYIATNATSELNLTNGRRSDYSPGFAIEKNLASPATNKSIQMSGSTTVNSGEQLDDHHPKSTSKSFIYNPVKLFSSLTFISKLKKAKTPDQDSFLPPIDLSTSSQTIGVNLTDSRGNIKDLMKSSTSETADELCGGAYGVGFEFLRNNQDADDDRCVSSSPTPVADNSKPMKNNCLSVGGPPPPPPQSKAECYLELPTPTYTKPFVQPSEKSFSNEKLFRHYGFSHETITRSKRTSSDVSKRKSIRSKFDLFNQRKSFHGTTVQS